jgi:UDP-N-acetylmuramoylalanine-D-glutamate ligase
MAARSAREGDVVLLSPAGSSDDPQPNSQRPGPPNRVAVAALERGS